MPAHLKCLLGLGLNFCVLPRHTQPDYANFKQFEQDIFLKMFFAHEDQLPENKLYIKSSWEPERDEIPIKLQARTSRFGVEINQRFKKRRVPSNLDRMQCAALRYFKKNKEIMAIKSDKNLGPCVIE